MKKITNIDYIKSCKVKHEDKYDYIKCVYTGAGNKVTIVCPKHGEFVKIARDHKNGQGCPVCSKEQKYSKYKLGLDKFIERAEKKHNNKYDYSKVVYKTLKDYITIICPEHGEFKQRADVHLNGEGCKTCYFEKYSKSQRLTNEGLIEKFKLIHGDKYCYSKVEYNGYKENITIICPEHGEFEQLVESHLHGGNCNKCNAVISKQELELREFIKSLNIKFETNNRKILNGKEIDIFLPEYNIAIEYNGLYWHSEKFISKDYHLNKTNDCEAKNIELIHIFEDEWINKNNIVKSRILNKLKLTNKKYYARKCIIKEIDFITKKKFINENHIQGDCPSKINLGLYYNDELVSIMTFGRRPSFNSSQYELIRFCNKLNTNVIGGASKLLKHFTRNYEPKEIVSYADRRWSAGKLYDVLGFELIQNTKPNWFIINNGTREHRLKYQKHKLVKMGFDKNKTANQILKENNFIKIYDCGTKKYYFKNFRVV